MPLSKPNLNPAPISIPQWLRLPLSIRELFGHTTLLMNPQTISSRRRLGKEVPPIDTEITKDVKNDEDISLEEHTDESVNNIFEQGIIVNGIKNIISSDGSPVAAVGDGRVKLEFLL